VDIFTAPDETSDWQAFAVDGLRLLHPPDWVATEERDVITLMKDEIMLRIFYGNLPVSSGMPAGDFRKKGGVVVNQHLLPVTELVHLERIKMVLYGDPYTFVRVGEYRVFAELTSTSRDDYDTIHLDEALQHEAAGIVATLKAVE
jgi:hypothetical protein